MVQLWQRRRFFCFGYRVLPSLDNAENLFSSTKYANERLGWLTEAIDWNTNCFIVFLTRKTEFNFHNELCVRRKELLNLIQIEL